MKCDETVLLPKGNRFESWEKPFVPSKTYHVAQKDPAASDDNDGTAEKPFRTVSKAASVLMPGEEAVIHDGIYREWVRPARGGDGPDRMIVYRAAEGEHPVITGSDEWAPEWVRTRWIRPVDGCVTYEATLKGSQFEGSNPFCLPNGRIDGSWGWQKGFEMCRGMIFRDGEKLAQVSTYEDLAKDFSGPGVFWVEENGITIHLRLRGDEDPNGTVFEITTREQVFAPSERYLNYIKLSGLTFRHAANPVPIPRPQRGMVSAFGGHHWIVEDCELAYANTVSLDLGGGWWYYGTGECQGFHIVRRNFIHHFGICGIAAWHNMANESVLVEDNRLDECCTMAAVGHCESAAIKLHRTENSLVHRNVVTNVVHGAAIWLDGEIFNSRITRNVCLNNVNNAWGQIFLEINEGPNIVDNNILWGSARYEWSPGNWDEGHGMYCHDASRIIVAGNLIWNGESAAVCLRKAGEGRSSFENEHRVYGNLIGGYRKMIELPNETSRSDNNVFGCDPACLADAFVDAHDEEHPVGIGAWRKRGFDGHSTAVPMVVHVDPERLTMQIACFEKSDAAELSFPFPEEFYADGPKPEELLTYDFFGNERSDTLTAGPFDSLPLDGREFSIDPREGGNT